MGWLAPLLQFLPLAIFATYAFWAGGAPTHERWHSAFLIGGPLALVQLAVLVRLREPMNRLALGADAYLLAGALAVVVRQWHVLTLYGVLQEAAVFAWMVVIGIATTLGSRAGYVGVLAADRVRLRRYSLYLLALTLAATGSALVFRGHGTLAVGVPLMALTLARRQLAERLHAGAQDATSAAASLVTPRGAVEPAPEGARSAAAIPALLHAGGLGEGGERLLAEFKARCPDLAAVRAILAERARYETTLRQTDTYFVVPRGRLKLREIDSRPAQLIFYERPDVSDVRTSQVFLATVTAPEDLRHLLSVTLGVRTRVVKVREIWRVGGVQVQLDTVDGLGDFVELKEVAESAAALPDAEARVRRLMADLGIAPEAMEARSYSDLVARAPATR